MSFLKIGYAIFMHISLRILRICHFWKYGLFFFESQTSNWAKISRKHPNTLIVFSSESWDFGEYENMGARAGARQKRILWKISIFGDFPEISRF